MYINANAAQRFLVNSVSLRPIILGEIKNCGEYEKVQLGGEPCERGKLKMTSYWINKLCRSMGLTMRAPTKRGRRLPSDWEQQGRMFLHRLAYLVHVEHLHKHDVFNLDQTGCQLRPHANGGKTRAQSGSTDVAVEEHDDKRLITLVPVVSAAGDKLPLQLIFKGTDGCARSIPDYKNNFRNLLSKCPGWLFTQTKNHWSSVETNLDLIKKVILPFARQCKERRRAEGMLVSDKILIILDCWTVHKDKTFLEAVRLECPDVILLFVPPNLTSKFQPLDVAINGPFKLKIKHVYAEWAGIKLSRSLEPSHFLFWKKARHYAFRIVFHFLIPCCCQT